MANSFITTADVEQKVAITQYHQFPGTTLTVAAVTLVNGFVSTGMSACVDPEDFNEELGRQYAREDAIKKIIPHEAYLARQALFDSEE